MSELGHCPVRTIHTHFFEDFSFFFNLILAGKKNFVFLRRLKQ